ncbi:hypothetical protein HDE_05306 [Halotydeus destructor]|nr:hypothetical protein HDE_05306 [Halotydeus destructor]
MIPMASNIQGPFLYVLAMLQVYTVISNVAGSALYLTVQYTFLKYAERISDLGRLTLKRMATMEIDGQELIDLRRIYSLFNEKRSITNAKLGILPFIWLSVLFITLTGGIADIVLNPQLYASPWTRALMALAVMLNMTMVFGLIIVGAMATDKLEEAKLTILQITQKVMSNRLNPLKIASQSLLINVVMQPVVPAMVWNMFAANKHLILQFAGSVIPFSVMMITTAIQQKQANCPTVVKSSGLNTSLSNF